MNKDQKLRVLLASHIGHPWGGISTCYQSLLLSSFPQKVVLTFIDTQDGRQNFSDTGRVSFRNVVITINHILRFVYALIKSDPVIVNIATSYGFSFAKHSVMIFLAKILNKKVVLAPHCSINKLIPSRNSFWKGYVLFTLKLCDGVIVISKEWLILKKFLPNLKIKYLPNVICIEPYLKIARQKNKKENNIVKISYIGHVGLEKGTIELLEAVNILEKRRGLEFIVYLVGKQGCKPGDLEMIKEKIQDLKIENKVKMLPAMFGDEKINHLSQLDCFVMPSHYEGMPISIIEAMASGLPVVATNVGGIPELVKHNRTGFLIEPFNVEMLADYLEKIINNSKIREKFGINGREWIRKNQDIEKYVDSLIEFFVENCKKN